MNSRFNCLNPRYNVGTPSFAPVDDYADEHPKERDDAASASDRHEAWDRDPAEAHAGALRDHGAEQQAEDYGHEGVVEQDEGFRHLAKWALRDCGGLVAPGTRRTGCWAAAVRLRGWTVSPARWESVNRLAETLH